MARSTSGIRVADALLRAGEEADRGFSKGILRALVAVRWLTATWATIGVWVGAEHLRRPAAAIGALGAIWAITVLSTWLVRKHHQVLAHPAIVVIEFAVAASALLVDVWVFEPERAQSLVWAWPAAVIMTAAIFIGAAPGALTALALGFASYFGDARNSQSDWGVAASSKTALYMLAAVVAAYVARRLREAEREISTARAREEVARTLHDGVLQTLAVVQRRSTDPELASLAEQQEQDLRDFLFGAKSPERTLPVALREAASVVRARDGLAVDVIVADDLPSFSADKVEAVAGAVLESLTNAAKHADADRVVVYAEPNDADNGVFCSVKDDGTGFDVARATRGQGIDGSITARIQDVGGRVEIVSRPDRGTEVQLWVP